MCHRAMTRDSVPCRTRGAEARGKSGLRAAARRGEAARPRALLVGKHRSPPSPKAKQ